MIQVNLVETVNEMRNNLQTFKSQSPIYKDKFFEFVRNPRQKYWVYEPTMDAFGISKFVAYKGVTAGMTYELYIAILNSHGENSPFYGGPAQKQIKRLTEKEFLPNEYLEKKLLRWADSICKYPIPINRNWVFLTI